MRAFWSTNTILFLLSVPSSAVAFLTVWSTFSVASQQKSKVVNHRRQRGFFVPLCNDVTPSSGGGGGDESFDVESAREQLHFLFRKDNQDGGETSSLSSSANSSPSSNANFDIQEFIAKASDDRKKQGKQVQAGIPVPINDSSLPPLPHLSTIERDRREAEIQLLEQLQDTANGDDVMKELWNLWYSERGGMALGRLQQADQLMGDPTSWQDCETSLLQLVHEYGIYFVEPLNRLATLYFLQGKYDYSYQLCSLILLKLKPWHLGALAGMVQVCISKGNREEARYWASKRLPTSVSGSSFPPFLGASNGPQNPRRAEWVQEMVSKANAMLKRAERTTKKQLGDPETYYAAGDSSRINGVEDELHGDAWQ